MYNTIQYSTAQYCTYRLAKHGSKRVESIYKLHALRPGGGILKTWHCCYGCRSWLWCVLKLLDSNIKYLCTDDMVCVYRLDDSVFWRTV